MSIEHDSMTIRRRAPEGSVFTTIWYDSDTLKPHTLLISVGKAGSTLNAAADLAARLAGAGFRAGASPGQMAAMIEDISHDHTNGHCEAKSLADAVGQSLRRFEVFVKERTREVGEPSANQGVDG